MKHIDLTAAPSQGARRKPIRNSGDKVVAKRSIAVNFSDITEVANKIGELANNGVVVEGGECGDEGSDN